MMSCSIEYLLFTINKLIKLNCFKHGPGARKQSRLNRYLQNEIKIKPYANLRLMRKTREFVQSLLFLLAIAVFTQCQYNTKLPSGDPANGGLFLPGGFEALVVVDSIGPARHIAVNDN